NLKLEMKIGDVEYQADKKKATFYYTAEGRVDFRELIRAYAKEFRVKIEMRQIGARQESARIGGIGSCGRELCCSTWLSDFKTVSTAAARYQNIAINQTKLSGQCGRLKCCLNYELDSYMDALKHFPKNADKLYTEAGVATLIKTDVFKGIMYYMYNTNEGRGKFYPLPIEKVKEILALNKEGSKPLELMSYDELYPDTITEESIAEDYSGGDLTGVVELPPEKRRRKKRNRNRKKSNQKSKKSSATPKDKKDDTKRDHKSRGRNKRRGNSSRNKKRDNTKKDSNQKDK
ncbi:MAG TPA: hypothetical protein ENJ45_06050, partial [Phaeodactylibacter sp.]|nr:hypothetical protein [Phaeodactylibacter sp.]